MAKKMHKMPDGTMMAGEKHPTGYQEGGTIVEGMESEEYVERPAEVPEAAAQGDANVSTLTFDEYSEQGVDQDLVDQGNELAQTLQAMDTTNPEATEDFIARSQAFIQALEAAREDTARDPETMRALKEMLNDAKDLQNALETIVSESQSLENNPDATLAMTGPAEEEIIDEEEVLS